MRDPRQPGWRRDRAARDAAPYCLPKLAVAVQVSPHDFATRLDEAIKRTERAKVIEVPSPDRYRPSARSRRRPVHQWRGYVVSSFRERRGGGCLSGLRHSAPCPR
jgi:hypothetical protein